jgi:uncharacterized protein YkwD
VLAAAVVALGILVSACGPYDNAPAPGCPAGPSDATVTMVFNRTNGDRAAHGLGALVWNPRLACLATEWSGYMAGTHDFRHRDLNAAIASPGYEDYASLGENILVGPGNIDGNQMQNAWLTSPGHYANIMGNYDSVGIGYARGDDGRIWVTANFARHF